MASITDILRNDPRRFNLKKEGEAKALRREVQQLADAANKRLRRLQKSSETSLALIGHERQGLGRFTTKGKKDSELLAEFKRAKEFLEAKTSTIAGAKESKKNVIEATNQRMDVQMDEETAKAYWETMKKVLEQTPKLTLEQASVTSFDAQKMVYEMVKSGMTDPVKIADQLTDAERVAVWKQMEQAADGNWLEDMGFFAT